MKTKFFISYLLILSIFFSFLSCSKSAPKKDRHTYLTGIIKNKTNNVAVLASETTFDSIPLNEDGSFSKKVIITDNNKFFIGQAVENGLTKKFSVYLKKGDSIHIDVDMNNMEKSLTFSGEGSIANSKYINEEEKIYNQVTSTILPEMSLEEIKNILDKAMFSIDSLSDNFEGLTPEFRKKEKKEHKYQYFLNLGDTMVGVYFMRALNPDIKGENFNSELVISEFEKISLLEEKEFFSSKKYRKLVENYYLQYLPLNKLKRINSGSIDEFNLVTSIPNKKIRSEIAFKAIKNEMTFSKDIQQLYKSFLEVSLSEENNKIIEESYKKILVTAKGSPSPIFTDYENFAGGTTSLKDLLGKYVYIDVWATWCVPCIAEMPYIEKLKKEFKGKNIVFLGISIDKQKVKEKWRKMIKEKNLADSGYQLITDNTLDTSFMKTYQIQSIPRFILIDPKGNIVDSNAPRPSSVELKRMLKELNI